MDYKLAEPELLAVAGKRLLLRVMLWSRRRLELVEAQTSWDPSTLTEAGQHGTETEQNHHLS